MVALYADGGLAFPVAVAAGLAFVGALGLLMEQALFRPLRDNPLGGLVGLDRVSSDPAICLR